MDTENLPRVESLKVRNFRVLRDVEIKNITPLTVLIGPNGCGKSTVLDVFAFLSECFESGLASAWEKRGKAPGIKSRDGAGPVMMAISYRERPQGALLSYRLEIDEENGEPFVKDEKFGCENDGSSGIREAPRHAYAEKALWSDGEAADSSELDGNCNGTVTAGIMGQSEEYPRAVALRDFIRGWHLSCFAPGNTRELSRPGSQEHLNRTGSNLANVIHYLARQHPQHLEAIYEKLRERIPGVQSLDTAATPDGRLFPSLREASHNEPIAAHYMSDGTLKMLAYLVLLNDPKPPPLIGLEEPENFLHPRLLWRLAEEFRSAASRSQILATTHSPFFLDALRPQEVRVLWRDRQGTAHCHSPADDRRIANFMDEGALLGDLWMEGYLKFGDPLTG